MTTYTALRAATGTAPTSAPRVARDPLLFADEDGAWRFLADFAFGWSYPGTTPVAADAVVRDMAERANGAVRIASGGGAPIIAGGGLDFSTTTRGTNGLEIPASVLATIVANSQEYLVMSYWKLPTSGNVVSNRALISSPLFQLRTLISGEVRQLQFRRLDTGTDFNNLTFSPVAASALGGVSQVAFWRDATATGFRLRTSAGTFSTVIGTPSRGDNNADVTTGAVTLAGTPLWLTDYNAGELLGRNMRLFRVGIAIPGDLPGTITAALDADYERTVARNVFS
jgi:hypothetical protein